MTLWIVEEEDTLLDNRDHMSNGAEGNGADAKDIKKDVLSIFDVIRRPEYNRAAIVVMMVMVAQQLCGESPASNLCSSERHNH